MSKLPIIPENILVLKMLYLKV